MVLQWPGLLSWPSVFSLLFVNDPFCLFLFFYCLVDRDLEPDFVVAVAASGRFQLVSLALNSKGRQTKASEYPGTSSSLFGSVSMDSGYWPQESLKILRCKVMLQKITPPKSIQHLCPLGIV